MRVAVRVLEPVSSLAGVPLAETQRTPCPSTLSTPHRTTPPNTTPPTHHTTCHPRATCHHENGHHAPSDGREGACSTRRGHSPGQHPARPPRRSHDAAKRGTAHAPTHARARARTRTHARGGHLAHARGARYISPCKFSVKVFCFICGHKVHVGLW